MSTPTGNTTASAFFAKVSFAPPAKTPVSVPVARLVVLEGDLSQQARRTLTVLLAVNQRDPRLFRRGSDLVRLIRRDDVYLLENLTLDSLSAELCELLQFEQGGKRQDGVPAKLARHLFALDREAWGLPVLDEVWRAPFFAEDGALVQTPGYHPAQRVWLDLGDLELPTVAPAPDAADVARATDNIRSLLHDFPFVNDASRANAVAGLLWPVSRALMRGEPTPFLLISAPSPATGKTLLAQGEPRDGLRREPGMMAQPQSDDEWNKSILSVLMRGEAVVTVDNLSHKLDCGALANMLTSGTYTGRLLNTGVETPQNRAFAHSDLRAFVMQHYAELLWSVLVLAQHWLAQPARPLGQVNDGQYRRFGEVIGGMTELAGFGPVLANVTELQQETDPDLEELTEFFTAWNDHSGDKAKAKLLLELADALDLLPSLRERTSAQVGYWLKGRVGRVVGPWRLASASVGGSRTYWLEECP